MAERPQPAFNGSAALILLFSSPGCRELDFTRCPLPLFLQFWLSFKKTETRDEFEQYILEDTIITSSVNATLPGSLRLDLITRDVIQRESNSNTRSSENYKCGSYETQKNCFRIMVIRVLHSTRLYMITAKYASSFYCGIPGSWNLEMKSNMYLFP